MKKRLPIVRRLLSAAICLMSVSLTSAQSPELTGIQRLTNNEISLILNAPTGANYRIDVSTDVPAWNPLSTLPVNTTTSLQYTDSAAPYLETRFYRAAQLSGTNLHGDHLVTTNGDVLIHPINHATFLMVWDGKYIYSDPVGGVFPFTGLPRADLILVTHNHSDHFNSATIDLLRATNGVIVTSATVTNSMTALQRTNTIVLGYGASTNILGLNVQAVHAYNDPYHPLNMANGYVVTIGGKRVYISGDTGNVPEIRALTNIDVAFLCMNQPFTMTVSAATNVIHSMRPGVVYPYHYRDQNGSTANAVNFKQALGQSVGTEVRLRKWY